MICIKIEMRKIDGKGKPCPDIADRCGCPADEEQNGMDVSYNVQTAVDSETHMIMDYLATNQAMDHGLMNPTMEAIREESGDKIIEVVADKGHEQVEDMAACLENGIIPNVILPDGQDAYIWK